MSSCFYRLAADLAGVVLTKPELEVSRRAFHARKVYAIYRRPPLARVLRQIASKIVKAEIVNHPQNEQEGALAQGKERKKAACAVL